MTVTQNSWDAIYVPKTSWTPTIAGTTIPGVGAYIVQQGTYTRIGKLITAFFYLRWSAHTGTGSMTITGLPVISAVGTDVYIGTLSPTLLTFPVGGYTQVNCSLNASSTTMFINATGDNLGTAIVGMDTSATVIGMISYFTN